MSSASHSGIAAQLNAGCHCISLNRSRLRAELEHERPGFYASVVEGRPHLFADVMVFVDADEAQRMAAAVTAVERVVAMPAYRAHVAAWAPGVAQREYPAHGVFLGYDFHLGPDGPQLIEINTNAGGALINAILQRAQQACCDEARAMLPGLIGSPSSQGPEELFMDMFRAEWVACRGTAPLTSVAIVDDDPTTQYLYPEFVLFQQLFARYGVAAVICDPRELHVEGGRLRHGGTPIDLVYNRLTDFAFADAAHAALRRAYEEDLAVVTPHPRGHALYADKRNLVVLSDDALLASWGVDVGTRATLAACIPHTVRVAPECAEDLWARRRQLFFKPAAGYGSRAAYRGDKITRRVFAEVLAGNYVAQAIVPPSSRRLAVAGELTDLKVDLRNYVYTARVQLVAARLWQGQTTNFRTPGGGFAPVLEVPSREEK